MPSSFSAGAIFAGLGAINLGNSPPKNRDDNAEMGDAPAQGQGRGAGLTLGSMSLSPNAATGNPFGMFGSPSEASGGFSTPGSAFATPSATSGGAGMFSSPSAFSNPFGNAGGFGFGGAGRVENPGNPGTTAEDSIEDVEMADVSPSYREESREAREAERSRMELSSNSINSGGSRPRGGRKESPRTDGHQESQSSRSTPCGSQVYGALGLNPAPLTPSNHSGVLAAAGNSNPVLAAENAAFFRDQFGKHLAHSRETMADHLQHQRRVSAALSIPAIVLRSALALLSVAAACCVLGGVYLIWLDWGHKSTAESQKLVEEARLCQMELERNKCGMEDTEMKIPHMDRVCGEWRQCVARDPRSISNRMLLLSKILGEAYDGFFKEVSQWTLICSGVGIAVFVLAVLVFGKWTSGYSYDSQYYNCGPPPTPHGGPPGSGHYPPGIGYDGFPRSHPATPAGGPPGIGEAEYCVESEVRRTKAGRGRGARKGSDEDDDDGL